MNKREMEVMLKTLADKLGDHLEESGTIKTRIENLMTWQKWQMGLLAAILGGMFLRFFH
jgi:hypothetical protein